MNLTKDKDRKLQELLAKQEIYEVLARYCWSVDMADGEYYVSCFHPDGTEKHGGATSGAVNARGMAEKMVVTVKEKLLVNFHHLSSIQIDVDGDTASSLAYIMAYHLFPLGERRIYTSPRDVFVGGRHLDRWERRDGVWRIKDKWAIVEWNQNTPASEVWAGEWGEYPRPVGRKSRQDPGYGYYGLTDSDRTLQGLLDKQEIYEAIARYCRALDRCDEALLLSCYCPESREDHAGIARGSAREVCDQLFPQLRKIGPVSHYLSNLYIDVDGDTASSVAYVMSFRRYPLINGGLYCSPHDMQVGHRYLDRWERRDGIWKVTARQVAVEWNQDAPTSITMRGEWGKSAALGGRKDRQDPSYAYLGRRAPTRSLQELWDKQEIYEVIMRYCRALDHCDDELFLSCYHAVGTEDRSGQLKGSASEVCDKLLREIRRNAGPLFHFVFNVLIDIDGDTATSETYAYRFHRLVMVENGLFDNPHDTFVGERYLDRWERSGGVWKIKERQVITDWRRDMPSSQSRKVEGILAEVPAPLMSKSAEDPSYRFLRSPA